MWIQNGIGSLPDPSSACLSPEITKCSHKRSVVTTLQSRAKSHCTSSVTTTDEMEHISQALQLNGYPRKLLQDRPALSRSGSSNPTEEPKWKSTAVIPYVHGVSESLRCIVTPLKVRVCFRLAVTIKQLLSHPKDPIPDLQ